MDPNGPFRVLLIEDNLVEAQVVMRILGQCTSPFYSVDHQTALSDSVGHLKKESYDVILLDLNLVDSHGLDTFKQIYVEAPKTAVVVLTGEEDEEISISAVREGAQDYLVKGDSDPRNISRVLHYAIERKRIQDELEKANEKMAKDEKVLVDILKSLQDTNKELRSTQLQLIQSEKLRVVGRMAAGVAHEVKNPLAMMRMGIDYLQKKLSLKDDKNRFMISSMSDAVKRADYVIKGMLDFASLKPSDLKEEDLEAVLNESLFLIKHELEVKGIKVTKNLASDLPKVIVNYNRMIQVFINLLTNSMRAIKAAENKNGEIKISAHLKRLEGFDSVVGYRKDDFFAPEEDIVILEIQDNGTGIPEDYLDKIFDPFFTTARTDGGTGLGLSVVKSIVQMHQGAIRVDNHKEGGAIVTLMIKVKSNKSKTPIKKGRADSNKENQSDGRKE